MYSYGSPHTAAQKQDDQHERTFSSYVRIQVVVLKTCLGRWTIGRSGERGSGISVLPARYDDDDIMLCRSSNYHDSNRSGFVLAYHCFILFFVLLIFFIFFHLIQSNLDNELLYIVQVIGALLSKRNDWYKMPPWYFDLTCLGAMA